MGPTISTLTKNTPSRHQKAANPESEQQAAEAAHARDYFPPHSDITTAIHLLTLWKGLAGNWPAGRVLRGGSSSSSVSLQETVLPACDLAVALLKTWPPDVAVPAAASSDSSSSSGGGGGGSSSSGSSSRRGGSSDVPDGSFSRSSVTDLIFIMSGVLMRVTQGELLLGSINMTIEEFGLTMVLMHLPSVQHLLLLQTACACHLLHKQRQGLSPIKITAAVAAVSGSKDVVAAAAAAEAAAGSTGSSGSGNSRGAKQQQYLQVPAHHIVVLTCCWRQQAALPSNCQTSKAVLTM